MGNTFMNIYGCFINSCAEHLTLQDIRAEGSPSLYWQLYKSLAAYRMALQAEQEGGFTYDWIVRTRFDTAWPRPCPPLRFFSRDAVWFGTHFW